MQDRDEIIHLEVMEELADILSKEILEGINREVLGDLYRFRYVDMESYL